VYENQEIANFKNTIKHMAKDLSTKEIQLALAIEIRKLRKLLEEKI